MYMYMYTGFHPDILARGAKWSFWNVLGGSVSRHVEGSEVIKSQGGAFRIQGGQMPPLPPVVRYYTI